MKTQSSLITFPQATTCLSLRVGQYFTTGGIQLRLDQLLDGNVVMRNVETNETRISTVHSLIEAIQRGDVTPRNRSDSGGSTVDVLTDRMKSQVSARQESTTALKIMLDKRAWIDALKRKGIDKITNQIWVRSAIQALRSGEMADRSAFAVSTLAATARQLEKVQGDWSQLIPSFSRRGGARQSRLDPRAEAIIECELDAVATQTGKFVRQEIFESIWMKIVQENLACPEKPIELPGASTMSRRINRAFDAFVICERNHGTKHARRVFRENAYPRNVPMYPLVISEYDDLDCGVFLIDSRSLLPCGRAYLTHGVCQSTRVPLGFDLSHQSRSYDSAIGAICDSLLPKNPLDPAFSECTSPWVGYGCQGTILMDNASYNKSQSMKQQSKFHTLMLSGARPYGPTEKSAIEDYNKRVKAGFCQGLPGWRGDKTDPDSVKRGIDAAALDIRFFVGAYVKWVTGVYLNKPRTGGLTPKQNWQQYYANHTPAVRWSREETQLIRLRPVALTFRESGGLLHVGLTYNSDALIPIRKQVGSTGKVWAFVDCKDLTYLMCKDPRSDALIRATCTVAHRYADGLTERQQSLILKMARRRGHKNPNLTQMVQAREELRELVDREARSTKLKRRQSSVRTGSPPILIADGNEDPASNQSTTTKTVETVMTQLEWSVHQLDEVELDLAEAW